MIDRFPTYIQSRQE